MRTQGLFGIIAVVLRAATLILQSLVIGGLVFHRWIAANDANIRDRQQGVQLVRIAAVALAATQVVYLGLNSALLMDSLGVGLADVVTANFFVAGLVTVAASLAIGFAPAQRLAHPGTVLTLLSVVVLSCGVLASHAVSRMDNRVFLATCTAIHQIAAAVWIGGLPQLWISLRASGSLRSANVAQR